MTSAGCRIGWSIAGALWALAATAPQAAAGPRAIVELFTSQGCSSCPPADNLLGDLAKDPAIIALTLPIDYWDYLGWKDTLADARFTARQKAYARVRGDRDVFTPQMIVNGSIKLIGNDRAKVEDTLSTALPKEGMPVPLTLELADRDIRVGAGAQPGARGEVWICAVAKAVPITIDRGENRGKQIVYHNVVRNWLKVGEFDGNAAEWSVPVENIGRDGIDAAVVYVQDGSGDKPGAMLGAVMTSLR